MLFARLLKNRKVDLYQLGVMLKACGSSEEQRALFYRAEAAGAESDVSTFNLMLGQLRFEGREEAARELQAEMARRGIEANGRTQAVLSRPGEELSRQRSAKLQQLLEVSDEATALALFGRLLASGQADAYQLGVMLKMCGSSEEQRALFSRAEAGGVEPNVSTFNQMLGQLRLEGREEDAHELQTEMAQRRINPDKRTRAVLSRTAAMLSRQRSEALQRLRAAGDEAGAGTLYDVLVANGVADRYQHCIMRGHRIRSKTETAQHGQHRSPAPTMRDVDQSVLGWIAHTTHEFRRSMTL